MPNTPPIDHEVKAAILNVFGSDEKANKWLNTELLALGTTPAKLLQQPNGKSEVLRILSAIAYGGVCALLATQIPVLPKEIAFEVTAHFRTLSDWLASVIERAAAQGKFKLTMSEKIEADTFMATVHGAMLSARAYGDTAMFGVITQPLLKRLL